MPSSISTALMLTSGSADRGVKRFEEVKMKGYEFAVEVLLDTLERGIGLRLICPTR